MRCFFNELRATKSESYANLYCYATAFVYKVNLGFFRANSVTILS